MKTDRRSGAKARQYLPVNGKVKIHVDSFGVTDSTTTALIRCDRQSARVGLQAQAQVGWIVLSTRRTGSQQSIIDWSFRLR